MESLSSTLGPDFLKGFCSFEFYFSSIVLCFFVRNPSPTNDLFNSISSVHQVGKLEKYFTLSNSKFCVKGVPLLTDVPNNVSFSPFSSICQSSDAPIPLLQRVLPLSHKGEFYEFYKDELYDRFMNSLGRFNGRDFLSISRFKTWWSTMWVGNSRSDLQMETQWVLLDFP